MDWSCKPQVAAAGDTRRPHALRSPPHLLKAGLHLDLEVHLIAGLVLHHQVNDVPLRPIVSQPPKQ